MENPGRVSSIPTWLKWVVGGKLFVIFAIFLGESGQLRLGESGLFASGDKANESAAAPETTGAQASAPAERKGFLDDLLELPELDTKNLKKEDVARYLSMADRKKRQLDERIAMLGKRERQLKQLEKSIDEKLKRLDDERKFFAQSIQQEKELQGQRLDKLVQLYDKMEPKKAAPVFEKMDEDLVVALFKKLRQKQVTLILETMNADKSVKLSEYFGRIRSGKEYDLLKEMNSSLRQEFADCKGLPKEKVAEGAEKTAAGVAELGNPTPSTQPASAQAPSTPGAN